MLRRRLIQNLPLAAVVLATPRIVRAEAASTLRFVPAADLAVLDPIVTSAYVTRNHGFLVFDTLFGLDAELRPQPQMVAGYTIDDGLTWSFTLRDGLRFHDGTPVLARDVVASIRRWAVRDSFGVVLTALMNDLTAPSDNMFRIRLKKPFPVMLDGFAHCSTYLMPIMPERLASMPATTQVPIGIRASRSCWLTSAAICWTQLCSLLTRSGKPRPSWPGFVITPIPCWTMGATTH